MANIERAQNIEECRFRTPAPMLFCALARELRVGAEPCVLKSQLESSAASGGDKTLRCLMLGSGWRAGERAWWGA